MSHWIVGLSYSPTREITREKAEDSETHIRFSAGAARTVPVKGVGGLSEWMHNVEERSTLRRAVTLEKIRDVAMFLFSDLARGVRGVILQIDDSVYLMGN